MKFLFMIDEKKLSKKSHHNSTSAKNQDSLITELKTIHEGAKPERRNVTFYEADEDTVDAHNTKATSSQTTAAYGTTNFAFGADDSSNSTKLCNKEKDKNKYRTDFKSSRAATSQAKFLRATTSQAISSRASISEAIPSRATTAEAISSRATTAKAKPSRAATTEAKSTRAATTEVKSSRATSAESKSPSAAKSSLDVVSSEDEYIPVTVIQSEPQTSTATKIG